MTSRGLNRPSHFMKRSPCHAVRSAEEWTLCFNVRSDGPARPGSPVRNGPLLTLKAAIRASSAESGRPTGAKNGV